MIDTNLILKNEEKAAFALRGLYRRHGYLPYKMSKFEEYDLYVRNKSFLASDRILTFTDTDGKLMALKPDVTLSILKNSRDGRGLQKVYYQENVYRPSPTTHGYREILQAGLECIGNLDDYAVGEVVMLAARSLETISGEYLLDLSHLGVVSGLIAPLSLGEDSERAILQAMGEKNLPLLKKLAQTLALPDDLTDALCRLTTLYAPPEEALPVLHSLQRPGPSTAAVEELEHLCRLLAGYGLGPQLRLDFSMVSDLKYYNGIIFKGYLPGLAADVLSGGRYDGLLHKMGRSGSAIGFAVYLDQLERFYDDDEGYDADILLLYDDAMDAGAVAAAANALLACGKTVRIDREIPQDFRYRELRDLRKEGRA
jgi:ATP phosphoribosyltransferase regulatory subunit